MSVIPNVEGVWHHIPTDQDVDVYPLEPAGGVLCVWGPDVGNPYTGARDTQRVWDTDEWQGHIPVSAFDNDPDSWRQR